MRRVLVVVTMMLAAVPALAQYPELDAALEALFAKDLDTVAKHLPPEVEKAVKDLPPSQKAALAERTLPVKKYERESTTIRRSDSPDVLIELVAKHKGDDNQEREFRQTVSLDKRVCDGAESMLRLKLSYDSGYETTFYALLKFIDSEWRIYEIEEPGSRSAIRLDDPELVERVRDPEIAANENAALDVMYAYAQAAVMYVSMFPSVGLPTTPEPFGPPPKSNHDGDESEGDGGDSSAQSVEPDAEHADLLPENYAKPPFEIEGYRFAFTGSGRLFTVIARPSKYGETGRRSFFLDETGVVRFTRDDTEPTASCEPVRPHRRFYGRID